MSDKFSNCRVALVENDDITRKVIESYLKGFDINQITRFGDGNQAWEEIRKDKFDLVVMDWIMPGACGLAIFNRIRRLENLSLLPVIVCSAQLDEADFSLLAEFPCTSLVKKPLAKAGFEATLSELMDERASYQNNFELIEHFINAIQIDGAGAMDIFDKIWKRLPNPVPLAIMAARILRTQENLPLAEKILRKAMDSNYKIIPVASELGKVLLELGKHDEARRVLNHAQNYSHRNVERLMLLGEVHLTTLEPDKARRYFSSVLEIDPRDKRAYHGRIIARNMKAHLTQEGKGAQIPNALASMLNAVGIKMIRDRKMQEGLDQYQAALSFVYSGSDRSRLAFNTGLGYMRWGKPKRALPWFQKAVFLQSVVSEKAQCYVDQIEKLAGMVGNDEEIASANDDSSNTLNYGEKTTSSASPKAGFSIAAGSSTFVVDTKVDLLDADVEAEDGDEGQHLAV